MCVLFSGGIDSAALVFQLKESGHEPLLLHIQYGQSAAEQEFHSALRLSSVFKINLKKICITDNTPKGGGLIVGRNAFLLTAALMEMNGLVDALAIGIHNETAYYDCSKRFFGLMKTLIEESSDGRVTLLAPFLTWPKVAIVEYFKSCGVPLELTYSCEIGTNPPCGKCLSCVDRLVCAK